MALLFNKGIGMIIDKEKSKEKLKERVSQIVDMIKNSPLFNSIENKEAFLCSLKDFEVFVLSHCKYDYRLRACLWRIKDKAYKNNTLYDNQYIDDICDLFLTYERKIMQDELLGLNTKFLEEFGVGKGLSLEACNVR